MSEVEQKFSLIEKRLSELDRKIGWLLRDAHICVECGHKYKIGHTFCIRCEERQRTKGGEERIYVSSSGSSKYSG